MNGPQSANMYFCFQATAQIFVLLGGKLSGTCPHSPGVETRDQGQPAPQGQRDPNSLLRTILTVLCLFVCLFFKCFVCFLND